jgi:ubiquinol-cytochrome c reductase cytochrome c1 subunit
LGQGLRYNLAFPGNQIAMPPPLSDESVQYADGTKATTEQEARDVVTFLTWAAEPNMEARKRMGVKVIVFLLVATGLCYAVKRKIWAGIH